MHTYVKIAYGFFFITAEQSGCEGDYMAHKYWDIYYSILQRKFWPVLALESKHSDGRSHQ